MKRVAKTYALYCLVLVTLAIVGSACQRGPETTNVNTSVNANAAISPPIANANLSPEPISRIAAREPEKYRAVVVLSAETEGGQKTIGIPTLSAEVARNGADRRVAFKLPDGSDLIYLEKAGQHLVVAPGRKQYAELTPEATGFQLQKLMTPGQLVSRLEKLSGIERVGEETVNGRPADKYRYARSSSTNTQAGNVATEFYFYLDKETGLPLRSELQAEASGDVQGVKGARIVAEMRDISTNIDASSFEVPAGYNKVPPEQVRQQINSLTNMASAFLRTLLAGAAQPAPAATVSPAVTP
jgi:hypothetical protein